MSIDTELEEMDKLQQESESNIVQLNAWTTNFRRSKKGHIITNSIYNIELILENDNLFKNLFAYDEFSQETELKESITLSGVTIQKGYIEDEFSHAFRSYIEQTYNFVPQPTNVESAVMNVSKKNQFHPLKDYLEEAEKIWDKQPRIKTLLFNYLGVEQSEYSYKGLLCLLIGAIQKIYYPYEKFDFIFDFIGDTGTGKTTFLQKLFLEPKGYYTDSMKSFTQTDDFSIMQRAWCVNDDELVISKKTGIEVLKKFASQKELEYRTPYARKGIRRPKNFVIVRTSNESGHLKDETGNRRFVPFKVSKEKQVCHPLNTSQNQLDDNLIKQIWGEAMANFRITKRPDLYIKVERLANDKLEEFSSVDSVKDIVYTILEIPVPIDYYSYNDSQRASYIQGYLGNNGSRLTLGTKPINPDDLTPRDRVRIRDLALEGFNEPYGKNNKRDQRIRLVMDNHLYWERSKKNGLRFGNQSNTGYFRKKVDK